MLVVCGILLVICTPAALWLPIPGIDTLDERVALAALAAIVVLTLFGGLAEAAFRASGKYALITAAMNALRLAEWAGWIAGLLLSGTFAAVALAGLAVRLAGTVALVAWAKQGFPHLKWSLRHSEWRVMRAMAKPAASFMIFPLANALNYQGTTLLVGAVLNVSAVAVFSTYRTLARVAVQATSILSHSLWVEFSAHFGRGGGGALRRLYQNSALLGLAGAVGLSAVLYAIGPQLLRWWTHSAVPVEPIVLSLMLLYAAVSGAWHVPRVLLLSTNQHGALAIWSLFLAAATLPLSGLLARYWQLEGVVLGMLIGELAVAIVCIGLAHRLLAQPALPPIEATT
jgi:O-antigen/teichoic acid export membrane protein